MLTTFGPWVSLSTLPRYRRLHRGGAFISEVWNARCKKWDTLPDLLRQRKSPEFFVPLEKRHITPDGTGESGRGKTMAPDTNPGIRLHKRPESKARTCARIFSQGCHRENFTLPLRPKAAHGPGHIRTQKCLYSLRSLAGFFFEKRKETIGLQRGSGQTDPQASGDA